MRLIIKNIKVKLVDESKHHSRNEQDSKMADVMPLKFVRSGIEAEIDEVCGDSEQVQRLQELGFCRGCKLKVLQQGSPCIVRFCGAKWCLRENDSANVFVKVGSSA